MKNYSKNGVNIVAKEIEIGERVTFGQVDIKINGRFCIGDDSHLGDCHIRGNNIIIGSDLYSSGGLKVGGGGCGGPTSDLTIGDRNTNHNDFINLARPVTFGDDVGLSPEVAILTHGVWLSVLEGYPCTYAPVEIKHKTIIGFGSKIMPGVTIGVGSVVGAGSVVTKDLRGGEIYGGVPAKKIGDLKYFTEDEKRKKLGEIILDYFNIAEFYGYDLFMIDEYPVIEFCDCTFNVETLEMTGEETDFTDTLRGHLRRYGIRFYTNRPFRNFGEKLVKQ